MRTAMTKPGALIMSGMALTLTFAILADDSAEATATYSERQKESILSLFTTSSAQFNDDGRVELVYDFETMEGDLTLDWYPDPEKTKGRVRWSREYEGTPSTVEHGIMIADKGMWLHTAKWKDVTVRVEYMSTSGMRAGDLLAAVFAYKKNKRVVGSNMGSQLVRVAKNRVAGKPSPKQFPTLGSCTRYDFGYRLNDGVFEAQRNGRTQVDSKENEKFLKGLSTGRAGLAWNGTVQGFIFKVTLEGTLDPEWVAKQVGTDAQSR